MPNSAVWVSHSSISDFLKCPRLYYLRNVYKDPKTHHKINLVNPPLALGQAVHEVLEQLAKLPVKERFSLDLGKVYDDAWQKVSGKLGGFLSPDEESDYRLKGWQMISRVIENPGPLKNKAWPIRKWCHVDDGSHLNCNMKDLPHTYLSQSDNLILCGKVDWIEYLEGDDSIHIIDFKTGKHDEDEGSLQLPIYYLLVKSCQTRPVKKISYWYLDRNNECSEVVLPTLEESQKRVLEAALLVKNARETKSFDCLRNGCFACRPFEAIINGEAEFIGVGGYNQDNYIIS